MHLDVASCVLFVRGILMLYAVKQPAWLLSGAMVVQGSASHVVIAVFFYSVLQRERCGQDRDL